MQIPPMRPTFTLDFPTEPDRALERLTTLVDDHDYPIEGRLAGNHLMLVIPPQRRHLWSPWLHLEVTPGEVGARVKGRFSPNPSVWTAFMLTYIALGTILFFMLMFALSQWVMDKPPSALTLTPIPIAIALLMYWASLIGQKMAQEQMQELYEASMGALSIAPGTPPQEDATDTLPAADVATEDEATNPLQTTPIEGTTP